MSTDPKTHVRWGIAPESTPHYHHCPECYTKAPCFMACTIEPDLSDERPTGAHAHCDDCATPVEVLWRSGIGDDGDPAEAIEVLHTRGRWPWSPGDPAAPRWFCRRCEGTSTYVGWIACDCCGDGSCSCSWGSGDAIEPEPTIAEIVAVANLGVPRLLSLASIASELANYVGHSSTAVTFRVMERGDIEAWSEKRCDQPSVGSAELAVALSAVCVGDDDLPEADGLPPSQAFAVSIARLGAYVVSINEASLVLAVEAT